MYRIAYKTSNFLPQVKLNGVAPLMTDLPIWNSTTRQAFPNLVDHKILLYIVIPLEPNI